MWQVAGSGFIGNRILFSAPNSSKTSKQSQPNNNKQFQQEESQIQETQFLSQHSPFIKSQNGSFNDEQGDGVFRFSSSGSPSSSKKQRNFRKKIGVADNNVGSFVEKINNASVCQRNKSCVGICLKRRKTCRNSSGNKCDSLLFKDCSSFGWGLGLGMICMMSAGKADINKLSSTIDETAKLVNDLKFELNKKLAPGHQLLSFDDPTNTEETMQKPVAVRENKESSSLSKHSIDVKTISHMAESDCASSVLTEEHQHEGAEMNLLEAELESELQKLPWCTTEPLKHDESSQMERHQAVNQSSTSYHSDGVHPDELRTKLSTLLIEQQESHITDLEFELNSAYSKLQEREAELRTLKECVKRLTEFSLSSVSDEESQVYREEQLEEIDSSSLVLADNTIVGTKRAVHFRI